VTVEKGEIIAFDENQRLSGQAYLSSNLIAEGGVRSGDTGEFLLKENVESSRRSSRDYPGIETENVHRGHSHGNPNRLIILGGESKEISSEKKEKIGDGKNVARP